MIVGTHWIITGNAQIRSAGPGDSGAVYTMTNDASGNRILVYSRNSNCALTFQGSVSTQAGAPEELSTRSDTALTADGLFIYTLDEAAGSISEFCFDESSQILTPFGTISDGLTRNVGMQGMAAC
jgi:6-phosphogluconolactonase (cycloisomerase 2 family)